jgi:hypothetical protein
MSTTKDLAQLFRRDLTRLVQEIQAFSDDQTLWQTTVGITNSVGNLALHLEGNLREFIGRQLGNIPYQRQRDLEFSSKDLSKQDLIKRIEDVQEKIPNVIEGLSAEQLESIYPEKVFKENISTQQFLMSLHAHLNWHLGQIDYLRRFLTKESAIELAPLP